MHGVRSILLRAAALLILAAILGGHVSELFDRWDNTLRTGRDADYAVVAVGACMGFAFALLGVKMATSFLRRWLRAGWGILSEALLPAPRAAEEVPATGPSPPLLLAIRI